MAPKNAPRFCDDDVRETGLKAHRWILRGDVLRKFEIGVDTSICPDYTRPTNEGGAPLAVEKFASRSALCEIQES
ncbi:MAG: hypothetical protein E5X49_29400, partial [Mesorhizobium sp.]